MILNHRRLTSGLFIIPALLTLFFVSCMGASSNIIINSNGSGTITQVFRVSLDIQKLGEGSEGTLSVPSDREDLERTIESIPGLRLVSFTSREDEKDFILTAEIAFDNPEALATYMESGEQKISIDFKGKKIKMHFDAGDSDDSSFMDMFASSFTGYDFAISFALPGRAKAVWYDAGGKAIQNYPGTCTVKDKAVSYSVPMTDLISLKNSMDLVITW